MYECIACEERVCVTCASKCHPAHQWSHSNTHKHQLEYIGFQRETYCGCLKSTCQALAVVDQREVEGCVRARRSRQARLAAATYVASPAPPPSLTPGAWPCFVTL